MASDEARQGLNLQSEIVPTRALPPTLRAELVEEEGVPAVPRELPDDTQDELLVAVGNVTAFARSLLCGSPSSWSSDVDHHLLFATLKTILDAS
eukprot:CAMPEP_0175823856 /NCGR_PEP_ID=MMETSP0107_2-20121207/10424_1 /TAXON_ID=195067 ORGANISM="Goniomonas pacifica, Strain CCMP1869" /NCGR_SAMPLE_ID=MMETSP0107_2 /ASSEMBLY_ACC=CAM_ASM_000203 /LENGTH=93 /DNA_ID=CAMNT_0017136395 /DNA_START=299 /DNA_END=578 /DNA_ORIENTATION=-